MQNYLNCIGKYLTEEKTGKKIALIIDLIFNPDNGKLLAVLANNNKIVLYENISTWKINIYIKSSILMNSIEETSNIAAILNKKISILGNKIKTESNTFLGYCENIIFDEKIGLLTSIIGRKYFLGFIPLKKFPINYSNIVKIEKDQIVVKGTEIKEAIREI